MRVTRLHVLLAFIVAAGVGYGVYYWQQHAPAAESPLPTPTAPVATTPQEPLVPSTLKANAADPAPVRKLIATVGESYRSLQEKVPSIEEPLKRAKAELAAGRLTEAERAAKGAWQAFKTYRETLGTPGDYSVVKGDTLWRIAAVHSPVRQGPGWVTIWKANKNVVKDFDRIEVGWSLRIPQQPTEYITAFWRPRMLRGAKGQRTTGLARRWEGAPVDASQLPSTTRVASARSLEVDVTQLPTETLLAQAPSSLDVDVTQLPIHDIDPGFTASALRIPTPALLPRARYR